MTTRNCEGFSLLEAIVAMVLVGSAGMALFAWINANIDTLARVRDANERSLATMNVVEYMQHVNPMSSPSGKAKLGDYDIDWRSEAIIQPVDGVGYPDGLSLHQLGLFRLRIQVARDDVHWFDLELKQVGHRRVRDAGIP